MRIKLPFKKLSYDGRRHQVVLDISLDTTQNEEMYEEMEKRKAKKAVPESKKFAKRMSSGGVKKCPGHKPPKIPIYDEQGKCSICGGFKY